MKIELDKNGKWVVVKVQGRIDSFTYSILEKDIQVLRRTGCRFILLDLSDSNYMNISGLKLIGETHHDLEKCNGRLVLLRPGSKLLESLEYFIPGDELRRISHIDELKKMDAE